MSRGLFAVLYNKAPMKAITYKQYGPPDVLRLEDIDPPAIGDDDVRVKVHAASVNSWDYDLVRGIPRAYRFISGWLKPKYPVIGSDIAGTVDAVGKNVSGFAPGDAVFGDLSDSGFGAFAEYACAPADKLARKPEGMTFEQAAATPQAGLLALQGLRKYGPVTAGQKVLINGAGGGVGSFAIQIAKAAGAIVTAVDLTAKHDTMRSWGADHVVDYTKADVTRSGERFDVVLDNMNYRSCLDYRRVMTPTATYVILGGAVPRILQLVIVAPFVTKTTGQKMGIVGLDTNPRDLDTLSEMFTAGTVIPHVDRVYSLAETGDAIRYLGDARSQGKIVISISLQSEETS